MSMTEGGCLCGAVRYAFEGDPAAAMVCHCSHCQKQSGSAFSTIISVPQGALTVTGEPRTYHDAGESGKAVERIFCSKCGSPLISKVEVAPGMAFIKAGTLDDTSGFTPAVHIWAKSKQCWVDIGDVPAFDTNPG